MTSLNNLTFFSKPDDLYKLNQKSLFKLLNQYEDYLHKEGFRFIFGLDLEVWFNDVENLSFTHAKAIGLDSKSFKNFQFDQVTYEFKNTKSKRFNYLEKYLDNYFNDGDSLRTDDDLDSNSSNENKAFLNSNLQLEGEKESDCPPNFDHLSICKKYTLKPLIEHGSDSLACSDIPDLESVKLIEVQLQFKGPYNDKNTIRSNDIFASLEFTNMSFPRYDDLFSASFALKFKGRSYPIIVKLKIPNIAIFECNENSHLIEMWLLKRGFIMNSNERMQAISNRIRSKMGLLPLPYQPWHKITELPFGGVLAEWKNFPEDLLILTQDFATAIPCATDLGCYMNVLDCGSRDAIGICTSEISNCEKRILTKQEIAVYRLNYLKLFGQLANGLDFSEEVEKIKHCSKLWRIGNFCPKAGYIFPVYCSLCNTPSKVEKIVNQLCISEMYPFLLIVPIESMITSCISEVAVRFRSKIIGIDEVLKIDYDQTITSKQSAKVILDNWISSILPNDSNAFQGYRFPAPCCLTWENIIITFISRDIISIKCGNNPSMNYERLHIPGMFVSSHREKKPSDRWFLLMAFAAWGPALDMNDLKRLFGHGNWSRIRAQKSALSKSLKQFFSIDDDPIIFDKRSYQYFPKLIIRQDTNCNLSNWMGDIHM